MNLSRPFVERPVATVLLTIGMALAGIAAFFLLPVAPLPQVDYPAISVSASLPGASPETMATSVATPLERRLGVIAGVNEMTSSSSSGSARISLQFDLNRKIDSAAREVQAAINASRADLPATLRSNPTYRKINPADSPVIILALTSRSRTPGEIYDAVSNVVSQRISQVEGVGDVEIGGGSLPAVRVELLPFALNRYGIGSEDVRAAIQAANANRPKGAIESDGRRMQIYTPSPSRRAADYADLVIAWRDGAPVRLGDVAQVIDGVENTRTLGLFNGEPAIVVLITRQPGANIIRTVDGVRALIPSLQAQLPQDIRIAVASDSTNSIRASLREIEITLMVSIALVVLVVGLFLRKARATVIPAVATVVSLLGTFGIMYLLGFSLNNLSLMALTVATGFVVDDAIVVLENTSRHIEAGMDRMAAALQGAREVGFTVLSISLSLVAVFIPLLFMDGQVGRLFREFAVTLSVAVAISLVISLTTTPMMCAWLLRSEDADGRAGALPRPRGRFARWTLAAQGCRAARLRACAGLGAGQQGAGHGDPAGGDRPQRVPVQPHPQGLFPAAGQRPARGRPARGPEHFVRRAGGQAAAGRGHHPQGPGGGHRGGVLRGRARGRRLHVREPQARVRAQRTQHGRGRPAAAAARRAHRPADLPVARAGPAHGRALEQLHLPVHAQERQPRRHARLGDQAGRAPEAGVAAHRRGHRPGRQGLRKPMWKWTATAPRAWA